MSASQYIRVKKVLEQAERPLALFEIQARIKLIFKKMDSDAAISARIRDIRHDMQTKNEGTILGQKAGPEKSYYLYTMVKDFDSGISKMNAGS